jgi:hypothetical protein
MLRKVPQVTDDMCGVPLTMNGTFKRQIKLKDLANDIKIRLLWLIGSWQWRQHETDAPLYLRPCIDLVSDPRRHLVKFETSNSYSFDEARRKADLESSWEGLWRPLPPSTVTIDAAVTIVNVAAGLRGRGGAIVSRTGSRAALMSDCPGQSAADPARCRHSTVSRGCCNGLSTVNNKADDDWRQKPGIFNWKITDW